MEGFKIKKRIKEIYNHLDKAHKKLSIKNFFPNYKFNKTTFYIYIGFVILVVISLFQQYGFERQTYFNCEEGTCTHPSGHTVIAPYEEGTPPPNIVRYFANYTFIGLIIVFLINHILFNIHWRKFIK